MRCVQHRAAPVIMAMPRQCLYHPEQTATSEKEVPTSGPRILPNAVRDNKTLYTEHIIHFSLFLIVRSRSICPVMFDHIQFSVRFSGGTGYPAIRRLFNMRADVVDSLTVNYSDTLVDHVLSATAGWCRLLYIRHAICSFNDVCYFYLWPLFSYCFWTMFLYL